MNNAIKNISRQISKRFGAGSVERLLDKYKVRAEPSRTAHSNYSLQVRVVIYVKESML